MIARYAIALALLACSLHSAAAQNFDVDAVSQSSSSSQAAAVAQGGSNTNIFTSPSRTTANINNRQSGSLRTTPSMGAPGLGAAAVETCYGPGVSAAVSVTGFGFGAGAGQYDQSCNRRLNARTIYAFGHKQAALNLMLQDPDVARAFGVGPQVVALEPSPPVVRKGYAPMALTDKHGNATPMGQFEAIMNAEPSAIEPPKPRCKLWRNNTVGDLCLIKP